MDHLVTIKGKVAFGKAIIGVYTVKIQTSKQTVLEETMESP